MSLLKTLKENPQMRSLFGKQELFIIEKQLLGVELTPSEKTRLSRDIRKKFKAIELLASHKEEFNLKKNSDLQKKIKNILTTIKESRWFHQIDKIILFGSTADKTRFVFSDIDIAVKFTKIDKTEAGKFRVHILGHFDKNVDIQVYNYLPDKIKKQIDEKGKTLYERNNKK